MSIYKDCDIRGVYEKELTDKEAFGIGRALASVSGQKEFCVGGDLRLSTPNLKKNLADGLLKGGSDVCDLGLIATPMMYFAIKRYGFPAGAMVTASHNPPEYNGIKFMLGEMPVTREDIANVRCTVYSGEFSSGAGNLAKKDIKRDYISSMTSRFRAKKSMRVVVDAGNGSMGSVAPEALRTCGYEVVELFCEPDGTFPNRTPNPAQYEKLTAVRAKVLQTKSDMGVAFDADGDRAVFIDDKGEVIISERSLALFVRWLSRGKESSVVYDQKSSSAVKREILRAGAVPVPERSGHTFIKKRFLELGSPVAGEVSGHFFFGELGYDDALFATLLMLTALGEWNLSLSQAVKDVICPPITPDLRFFCQYDKQDEKLALVEKAFPEGKITRMDGVRIELDSGWILARKSVTAEQITLRAEGADDEALKEILRRLSEVFEELKPAKK